jgi:hypothetical protein
MGVCYVDFGTCNTTTLIMTDKLIEGVFVVVVASGINVIILIIGYFFKKKDKESDAEKEEIHNITSSIRELRTSMSSVDMRVKSINDNTEVIWEEIRKISKDNRNLWEAQRRLCLIHKKQHGEDVDIRDLTPKG